MSGMDGMSQSMLLNFAFQNNLNPISRKSFDVVSTESPASAQNAEAPEETESPLAGFSPKQTNFKLESAWQSFVSPQEEQTSDKMEDVGQPAVSDKMVDEAKSGPDGRGAPYKMNRNDNVENRELKMGYAGLYSMFDNLKPDPTVYDKSHSTNNKDGSTTVREETKDGKWREVTTSADGKDISLTDAAGTMTRKGSSISYVSSTDDYKDVWTQNANGQLTEVRTKNGETKTKVAEADGGYREQNVNGQVTKHTGADPNMARFEAQADRMGQNMGPNGEPRRLTEEQRYQLGADLSRFDPGTLKNLEENGVKIKIWDHENPPPNGYPGGRAEWKKNSGGYYVYNDKSINLKQSNFRNGGNIRSTDITHHEMGHAVDDLLAPDTANGPQLKTDQDPYLQGIYQDYKARAEADKSQEWSAYGTTNPQEYFAEGVSEYLGGDKAKQTLMEKDPKLYAYVEQKMNQSKNRSIPYRQMTNYNPYGGYTPSVYTNRGGPYSPSQIPRGNNSYMQPQQQSQYMMMQMMFMMQQMFMMLMAMQMGGMPFMGRM
jgi:hypothetical protein